MKWTLILFMSCAWQMAMSQHQNELGVKAMYGYGITNGTTLTHAYAGIDLVTVLGEQTRVIYGFGYLNKKYTMDDYYISNNYFSTSALAEFGDVFRYGLGAYLNIKLHENNNFGIDGFKSPDVNDLGLFIQTTYSSGKIQPFISVIYSPIENEHISILGGLRYSLCRK